MSRDELILAHLDLVRKIAGSLLRLMPPSIELDDMVSDGTVGLIRAADKYEPSRNNRFDLYAKGRIRGAIIDANRRRHYANATHAPLDEAPEPKAISDVEARIDSKRRARNVAQVIEMLPRPERQVVRQFYGEDQTNADIGRRTGVAARKVCEIHRRALVTLRRDFAARGVRKAA